MSGRRHTDRKEKRYEPKLPAIVGTLPNDAATNVETLPGEIRILENVEYQAQCPHCRGTGKITRIR